METILKVHHLLKRLVEAEHSFYAVQDFLAILYELSTEVNYKVLSSSFFCQDRYPRREPAYPKGAAIHQPALPRGDSLDAIGGADPHKHLLLQPFFQATYRENAL